MLENQKGAKSSAEMNIDFKREKTSNCIPCEKILVMVEDSSSPTTNVAEEDPFNEDKVR